MGPDRVSILIEGENAVMVRGSVNYATMNVFRRSGVAQIAPLSPWVITPDACLHIQIISVCVSDALPFKRIRFSYVGDGCAAPFTEFQDNVMVVPDTL